MPSNMVIALVVLLLVAAWSDFRTRRIPNWITLTAAIMGLIMNTYYGGLNGALGSLAGAGLGLGIFLILFLLGGMGAGDVKLFGAVGAFVGPQSLILVFVITGLLGGAAAAFLAACRGQLRPTLERTGNLLYGLGRLQWQEVREGTAEAGRESLRLPYGAVIAGGTILSLLVLR